MDIQEGIALIVAGRDLTQQDARCVMEQIMSGKTTDAQIAAYIMALRMKGETVEEIAGSAEAMREKALSVAVSGTVVDTCGTGGDASGTFNISTTAAFVVAACGITVAKHGNRSISSKSGSADLLKALGVNIDADVIQIERCLRDVGIGFLFAPRHHGAMRYAMGPRREIGVRTVFNLLGPLTNPAGAPYQLLGVFDASRVEIMARALEKLGANRALVVHGSDGLDEITTTGITHVAELKENGDVESYTIDPEAMGFQLAEEKALKGGKADFNAEITRSILNGQTGPQRDIVVINAAAALYVAGVSETLKVGIQHAQAVLDDGRARQKLEQLVQCSHAAA